MGKPSSVSERDLIAAVTSRFGTSELVLLGPGDDAALVAVPDGRVVATTDVLVEGVHFRLDWSNAYDIGRKAAAANLADVMAMGGTATALLVGLAAPPARRLERALMLADGLANEAAVVGAVVVGGDTVRSEKMLVSVTALGTLAGRAPVTRAGARPGDVLVLCGQVGESAAGLEVLQRDARTDEPWCEAVLDAHRRPTPPYPMGPLLAQAGATAMCDVSDALLSECGHLATASGALIEVDAGLLPVSAVLSDAAGHLALHPLDLALTGGEDHALLATLPPDVRLPAGAVAIGRVLAGQGVRVIGHEVRRGVWSHFG